MRRLFLTCGVVSLLGLAACGSATESDVDADADAASASTGDAMDTATDSMASSEMAEIADAPAEPAMGSLEWAIASERRREGAARDDARNPLETLEFFEIDPSGVIVEIWPGSGWYSEILAPWIAANNGQFVGATFPADSASESRRMSRERYETQFSSDPVYGSVEVSAFNVDSGDIVTPGSADAVLSFRNIHNWMDAGFVEKAFDDFYRALAPGGVLGIVEHRLPDTREQDPMAGSGYVQQAYVIALAEEAGFELVGTSEVNANPLDTADHPFGVWTLPPSLRGSAYGTDDNPDFDHTPYEAIGESDRMTLLFRKPVETPVTE